MDMAHLLDIFRRRKRRRRSYWDSESYDSSDDGLLDFDVDTHDWYLDDMDDDSENASTSSQKSRPPSPDKQIIHAPENVSSLADLATKVVAKHVTCEELEQHDPPIDEGTLKKIAFWAFPQDENLIKVMAKLTLPKLYEWNTAERKVSEGMIKKIRQVGFMVAAFVETRNKEEARVSMTFEKQHLTSTYCSACTDSVFCSHIIAVIMERMKKADQVPVHAPVTETLSTLSRDQLQKLLQYAINEDPGGVLGRVFQHIDELRDPNSELNQLAGAPDPTFGMFPGDKSTLDLSLEKMKIKLVSDLSDGYNAYGFTCDLVTKANTSFYDKYFSRVGELISRKEHDAAGRVLITMAETTMEVANIRWSSTTKQVFLDVDRMFSIFIACFTGEIRQTMIEEAQTLNRKIKLDQSRPTFLVPQHWSEMMSIKLKNIGRDNMAVAEAYEGGEDFPFYEPLVASCLHDDPPGLDNVLAGDDKQISDGVYDEPVDVMMFRFECLVQYYEWSNDSCFKHKICALGSVILKKLLIMTSNFSVLVYDEKRTKAVADLNCNFRIKEPLGVESADQTPSKKSKSSDVTHSKSTTRGEATRQRKLPKGKRKSLGEIEELENDIKIEMERASTESLADGLSKGQLCYSMLYICYRIWNTGRYPDLHYELKNILLDSTLRVFELSRFRYYTVLNVKELGWWEFLLDKIRNSIKPFTDNDLFKKRCQQYCKAMLQSKLNFYGDYLPLPLIGLMVEDGHLPLAEELSLVVDVLCSSDTPVYKFQFNGTAHDYSSGSEKASIQASVMKVYKNLLHVVFKGKSQSHSSAANKVLLHVMNVHDGEYVVAVYNCVKVHLETITEKEDQVILLEVLLECIRDCVTNSGRNGLATYSSSIKDTLIFLSKSLSQEFTKQVLPLWSEMCRYFQKPHLKAILDVIRESVKQNPKMIVDMAPTLQKYYSSSLLHDRECCSLLKIFFPDSLHRHQIYKKISSNTGNYTVGSLLRIGVMEFKLESANFTKMTIFNKHICGFFMLGLKPLLDRDSSGYSVSLHLSSKELKYLKWYFDLLALSVTKENIKGNSQFTKLMTLLKEVLKKDVSVMLDFYRAMSVNELALKETKSLLESQLVHGYYNKFKVAIGNCNHTYYSHILEEMKTARESCRLYIPHGEKEFDSIVVSTIRNKFKSKRKLVHLIKEMFPQVSSPTKMVKKGKKKDDD